MRYLRKSLNLNFYLFYESQIPPHLIASKNSFELLFFLIDMSSLFPFGLILISVLDIPANRRFEKIDLALALAKATMALKKRLFIS